MVQPPARPAGAPGARGDVAVREPSPLERSVARRTAEARATVPDIEFSIEVDAEPSVRRCAQEGCSIDAVLVQAVARGLREVPRANGAYRDARLESYARVNVGLVVVDERTYAIPTIFDADTKSVAELNEEIAELTARSRARTLPSPAFSGATFTFWNAGALGFSCSGIVINPPQAAALAAGAIREVPVVRNGALVAGRMLTLTLACDHRILYGAHAAQLLASIRAALEQS